jgi:predicted enzyme related to lactoylglutathione lyase
LITIPHRLGQSAKCCVEIGAGLLKRRVPEHVLFAVEDIDDTVARLRPHGAELVGEMVQYEDRYRLCYMRGPAGIIVALAEELF